MDRSYSTIEEDEELFYNDIMKEKDAYENEKYISQDNSQIWKRKNWEHKVCSTTINPDYDKQYCLLGIKSLYNTEIKNLYENPRNDFILLDNEFHVNYLVQQTIVPFSSSF